MVLLLKNLLFTIVAPGTVAVYVPLLITRNGAPASGASLVISLVLFGVGGAAYLWCVWNFATFGRGTPAPIDAPKKLVVRGLYRYTRNPMYVGVLTAILGWIVLYRAAALIVHALFLGIAFNLFIIYYEERHLRRQFGSEYDDYCARVRRWLPTRPRGPAA
ncbi:MAG: isoprenylcysteine carboxylmethyltransferase family protein [Candidatus Krumholzibacteria bacterium]